MEQAGTGSNLSSTSAFDTAANGKKEYRKGYQSSPGTASDANQDDLRYKFTIERSETKNETARGQTE